MKLFNYVSLILIINVVLLAVFVPPSSALSHRRRGMYAVKKIGALAMLMKMQGHRRKMLIPIPIPIPIGLLKELKRHRGRDGGDFFCEHHNQFRPIPRIHAITSWPTQTELVPSAHFIDQSTLNHHNLEAIHQVQPVQTVQSIVQPAITFQRATLKSEPIIALQPAKPITIPVHVRPSQIVLPPETEAVEIRPEPIVEIEQTTEPINEPFNNQYVTKNLRRGHLQNREY